MPQQHNVYNKGNQKKEYSVNKNDIIMKIDTAIDEDKDKDGKVLIGIADDTGKLLKEKGVTVTQLRKIYNEVRNIELNDKDCLFKTVMLKSKMAYAAGRFNALKDLYDIVKEFIDKINGDVSKLKRFKQFFEAVVAYNRYYSEKE